MIKTLQIDSFNVWLRRESQIGAFCLVNVLLRCCRWLLSLMGGMCTWGGRGGVVVYTCFKMQLGFKRVAAQLEEETPAEALATRLSPHLPRCAPTLLQ